MNKIKFSHDYPIKFPFRDMNGVPCRLIQVLKVHYDDLSEEFKKYDTYYLDEDDTEGYYKLPKTNLLILFLVPHALIPPARLFTTIRRWTPKKEKFYRSKIGEEFRIEVKEVKEMPDRDGKGPRARSPRPSRRKGGLKRGGC